MSRACSSSKDVEPRFLPSTQEYEVEPTALLRITHFFARSEGRLITCVRLHKNPLCAANVALATRRSRSLSIVGVAKTSDSFNVTAIRRVRPRAEPEWKHHILHFGLTCCALVRELVKRQLSPASYPPPPGRHDYGFVVTHLPTPLIHYCCVLNPLFSYCFSLFFQLPSCPRETATLDTSQFSSNSAAIVMAPLRSRAPI